jgi:hypothetical protein
MTLGAELVGFLKITSVPSAAAMTDVMDRTEPSAIPQMPANRMAPKLSVFMDDLVWQTGTEQLD